MKAVSTILFSLFFTLAVVVLSYKIILVFTPLTGQQQDTLDYLQGKKELSLPYTELEQLHLQDVRMVMNKTDNLFYVSLLAIIAFISHNGKQKQAARLLRAGSLTIIGSTVAMLLMVISSFSSSFAIFHQLFFPQGNWQFPINSLLIQIFPLEFFISLSIQIFVLTLLLALIIYIASKRMKKQQSII